MTGRRSENLEGRKKEDGRFWSWFCDPGTRLTSLKQSALLYFRRLQSMRGIPAAALSVEAAGNIEIEFSKLELEGMLLNAELLIEAPASIRLLAKNSLGSIRNRLLLSDNILPIWH